MAVRDGIRALLLGLALLPAMPVFHAQAQTVGDVEQAWRDWMTKHGRASGGLAVLHKGRPVHEATMGRVHASEAVPLASLSKAVSAVCAAHLVEIGRAHV